MAKPPWDTNNQAVPRDRESEGDSALPPPGFFPANSERAVWLLARISCDSRRHRGRGQRLPVWIAAVSSDDATCHGLQSSYGVSPIQAPEDPGDWSAFARRLVRDEGLAEGLVVLTEVPSRDSPEANPRLEIFDLRHKRISYDLPLQSGQKTMLAEE